MPIQSGTFKPLPPEDELLQAIEQEKAHNADLISYLLYIMPVAERFGARVYETAAQSLSASGVPATGSQLRALAEELKTPAGQEKYKAQRDYHLFHHVTG